MVDDEGGGRPRNQSRRRRATTDHERWGPTTVDEVAEAQASHLQPIAQASTTQTKKEAATPAYAPQVPTAKARTHQI
jgi:hypothetical protein